MKNAIGTVWAAVLVGSLFGLPVSGFAQGPSGRPSGGIGIAKLLAGTAVSNRDLRSEAGRGLVGTDTNNVNTNGGGGSIMTSDSINNNSGITTVFQNTGNNSLFQNETVINVTIH